MARVPDLKRITVEDFKREDQDLVRKLAFVINSFHEQVRSALNRSLNTDNLEQDIITLSFATGDNAQPLNPVIFRSTLINRVRGIVPISLNITSNNQAVPTQAPFISFTQEGNQVTINNIAGLDAGITYELTILTIT
jgi:hypothetical protein